MNKKIFEVVKRCIDFWNPYNLFPDCPEDEFDPESMKISEQISFESEIEEIAEVVSKVFSQAFSASDFGIDRCVTVAEHIYFNLKPEDEWKTIKKQKDIDYLMEQYAYFHDACIVSIKYESGDSVDGRNIMHGGGPDDHILSIVFNTQAVLEDIELQFIGVRQSHIAGWQDNYLNEIPEATLAFIGKALPGKYNNLIMWADCEDYSVKDIENKLKEPSNTYVVANSLRWKFIK